VLEYDVYLIYDFYDGVCEAGLYMFSQEYTNENLYVAVYEEVNAALISKYGFADTGDMIWKNELYKGKPSRYGHAVVAGHLTYFYQWLTPAGTTIYHIMNAADYEVNHLLFYCSERFLLMNKQFDISIDDL
jgi:hypothetical protein